MCQLTEKQHRTLETIAHFITHRGASPTFAELRTRLGISSNQSLIDRLDSLSRRGLVTRDPKRHRSIVLGPKAKEYFRSFETNIASAAVLLTHGQLASAFDSNSTGANHVSASISGDFAGNSATSTLAVGSNKSNQTYG